MKVNLKCELCGRDLHARLVSVKRAETYDMMIEPCEACMEEYAREQENDRYREIPVNPFGTRCW